MVEKAPRTMLVKLTIRVNFTNISGADFFAKIIHPTKFEEKLLVVEATQNNFVQKSYCKCW